MKQSAIVSSNVSDDLLWQNVRSTRDSVHHKVSGYSREKYIKEDLLTAWDEWCMGIEEPVGASEKEFSLFMTWFLHNWVCPRLPEPRARIAIMYLADRFSTLNEKEQEYLRVLLDEPITFYEVIEARPGHGIQMRCILTGRELYVSERSGSQGVHPRDIFFGRLGILGEIAIFDAVSDILIPPSWKGAVLELRSHIKRLKRVKKDALLKTQHVLDFEEDIREVYREFRDRSLHPRAPTLVNTDGEPLTFNKVIFEITSSNDAFEALHALCFNETFDSLLDLAEVSMDNNIVHVEFPWLKKGNKTHRGMKNTVLGHITIERDKLTIDVNSHEREKAIKEIVLKRCKGNARYKTTLIEPLEAKLAEMKSQQPERPQGSDEERAREQQELMNNPEVKEKLREMQRKHMEAWATERIPALGNKTPVQAMKTAEEREMVIALLTEFERSADNLGDRDFELELIHGIKKQLGLVE